MRVLLVLMWKHALVRKRRCVHTIADCVAPLLFFVLLFAFRNYFRSKMDAETGPEENKSGANTMIQLIDDIMPPPYRIIYSPEAQLTDILMGDVGTRLKLQKLASNADRSEKGYFPLAKGSRLADFATNMQNMEAVVIFHDMSGTVWPERINYTIRMMNAFHTETYETLDENPGPHKNFGLEYGTFMRIQWAIDLSYISRMSENIPMELSLQEFPYHHTDKNMKAALFCKFLTAVCWMSLMVTYVFLMCNLLQERTSGIQELMKSVGVSLNNLGISHFLNVLPCGIIFASGATIILKVTDNPLVPKTDGVLICLMLLLYFNTVVSFAFVCSYISRRTHYAETLSVLTYMVLWIPARVLSERKLNYTIRLITGILPHMPIDSFWKEVFTLEIYGIGANFGNITTTHTSNNVSTLVSIILMLLQSVICYLLAWYLSLVRPGYYGQALPWDFFFNKKEEVKQTVVEEEEEQITIDPKYFEPAPARTEVGIKIVNVSKVYSRHRALRNVSLDVYKGEITVLVGHNGAGKTTLMSIITGMTSATEGKVYVNGKDSVAQKNEVRKNISLCPQYNLFFEDLTVQQHIMFFTLLKLGSFAEARISSRNLADRLGLSEKLGSLTKDLSGGMKRRTQLACALAGGASVLVLDEPTSGLDVETRRELWDLLLSLRGERTVLLSTHFMEEADALGDRVAALHAGVLRCFATTMHLKKAVGTGYRLSFTTIGLPKEKAITKVVTSHVPDATLKEQTNNSIAYNLPAMQSGKFPELFADLEAKRSKLGLDSIGVGVSTLEEVFLKLCSDIDTTLYEDEVDNAGEPEPPPKKLTGIPLYMRQLIVLLKRQVMYAKHQKSMFVALHFILPIVLIVMITYKTNTKPSERPQRAVAMNLDMYGGREGNRVLYYVDGPRVTQADVDKLRARYPKITFEETDNVATTILKIGQMDILQYNKYLVGVEVKQANAKILYTTTVRHAAPAALNLLSNLLAAHYVPRADGNTITTMNDPISRELYTYEESKQPKQLMPLVLWGFFMSFNVLITNINSLSLPCKERQTGSRHIHIMSGCPAEVHWLATLSFHVALCVLGVIVPIVIAALALEKDETINQVDFLGAFVVVLLLGSLAFFAYSYIVSFNFGEELTNFILVVTIFIFGVLTPIIGVGQEMFDQTSGITYHFVLVFFYVATPHTMVLTGVKCMHVGYMNAMCKLLRKHCPKLFINEAGFDSAKCCAGENPRCYFCIDKFSPGKGMIILAVQFLLMMTMVFLIERRIFNGLVDKVLNLRYKPTQPAEQDKMVRMEKAYVSRTITKPVKEIPDAMLVDDLHKNYVAICKKKVNAVKGVSFSVKKGECFGLLGVNGAGKSTCFKMITSEVSATRGNIFSNGYYLRRGNTQYLQTLGYCPQFFGLDMFQTGEQNLAMVLTLRGFDRQRVENEVKNWIHIVGLEKYAQNNVEDYSGGCMRRLSAAAALCGSAHLSLLDEPSSGVDVAARRRLWMALRKALRLRRAVVITSHSMEEMEALCSRIAIMSAGRVRALGTAAGLRAAHAKGHAVVFKVTYAQQENAVDGDKTELSRLKRKLQETFNCTLTDEHQTMLHYHINETMQYSDLFSKLESLREEFPSVIEDYSVTETTLEEVFLSLAKEEEQQNVPHAV